MIRGKYIQFFFTVTIFAIAEINTETRDNDNDFDLKDDSLPVEFANFVNGLDKMVFKSENKKMSSPKPKLNKGKSTKKHLDSKDIKTTQNAALRDVLMMKLVSYYEDKYNVEQSTTLRTIEPLQRMSWRRSRAQTKGFFTKPDEDMDNTFLPRDSSKLTDMSPGPSRRSFTQEATNTLNEEMLDIPQSLPEVIAL